MGLLRARFVSTGETVGRVLDECLGQVRRAESWLANDCVMHWKIEARKREQKLSTALADLQRAQIARPDVDPRSFFDQNRAIRKAKDRREEAALKLRRIKYWQIELQRQLVKLRGRLQPMQTWTELDVANCVAWLRALEQHLDGYLTEKPPAPDASLADSSDPSSDDPANADSEDTP